MRDDTFPYGSDELPGVFDGGRVALAGFLYQMIAVFGLQAAAEGASIVEGPDALTAIMHPLRERVLFTHESLGQDAAIRMLPGIEGVDEYTLIQFKYSLPTSTTSVSASDMREIADRFRVSAEATRGRGASILRYFLVTNRHVTAPAKRLVQTFMPDDPNANVYSCLTIADHISLSVFERWLIDSGREYGAENHVIERGIRELIGSLISRTAHEGEPLISQESIIEAFTGNASARKITWATLRSGVAEGIEQFRTRVAIGDHPVRRQLLSDIAGAAQSRALVIITGGGGCGKSAALWQWADELYRTTDETLGVPIVLDHARRVRRLWPTEILCAWGNYPVGHQRFLDRERQVAARLKTANPKTAHPVLLLGLDGLDEDLGGSDQRHTIEELVRWFAEEDRQSQRETRSPLMTLVVTCRDIEEFWGDFVRVDVSGYRTGSDQPLSRVPVDVFSDEELRDAARQEVPHLADRIEEALRLRARVGQRAFTSAESSPFGSTRSTHSVNAQVLDALTHPAMWGAFIRLRDANKQDGALAEDRDAHHEMARIFVDRFIGKAQDRGHMDTLHRAELHSLLRYIAHATLSTGRVQHTASDWRTLACDTQMVNSIHADRLREEALSGGMIEREDAKSWRWRHRFVEEFLASTEPSEGE